MDNDQADPQHPGGSQEDLSKDQDPEEEPDSGDEGSEGGKAEVETAKTPDDASEKGGRNAMSIFGSDYSKSRSGSDSLDYKSTVIEGSAADSSGQIKQGDQDPNKQGAAAQEDTPADQSVVDVEPKNIRKQRPRLLGDDEDDLFRDDDDSPKKIEGDIVGPPAEEPSIYDAGRGLDGAEYLHRTIMQTIQAKKRQPRDMPKKVERMIHECLGYSEGKEKWAAWLFDFHSFLENEVPSPADKDEDWYVAAINKYAAKRLHDGGNFSEPEKYANRRDPQVRFTCRISKQNQVAPCVLKSCELTNAMCDLPGTIEARKIDLLKNSSEELLIRNMSHVRDPIQKSRYSLQKNE